jgi:hypothetical protein
MHLIKGYNFTQNTVQSAQYFLAYFPYFEEIKVGLCDLHAVCVSVNPPAPLTS